LEPQHPPRQNTELPEVTAVGLDPAPQAPAAGQVEDVPGSV
jgi:hypothetical protein